jgi:hypothetical protein
LSIIFLSKIFGDVTSPERSLVLFICNVMQIVLMFSIWYELLEPHLTKWEALFAALLVLGTLGYKGPEVVVGIQIATDLLLLAIFLAHLVGRVGYQERKELDRYKVDSGPPI